VERWTHLRDALLDATAAELDADARVLAWGLGLAEGSPAWLVSAVDEYLSLVETSID
jgi:hypothetical protein